METALTLEAAVYAIFVPALCVPTYVAAEGAARFLQYEWEAVIIENWIQL